MHKKVSGGVFLTARISHHLIPDGHVLWKKNANITVSIIYFSFNILNIVKVAQCIFLMELDFLAIMFWQRPCLNTHMDNS